MTETAEVGAEAPATTSLSIGINMPFDIRSIKCPTHPVKIKVIETSVKLMRTVYKYHAGDVKDQNCGP